MERKGEANARIRKDGGRDNGWRIRREGLRRIAKTGMDICGEKIPPSKGCKGGPTAEKNLRKFQQQQQHNVKLGHFRTQNKELCTEGGYESERVTDLDSGEDYGKGAKCLKRDDGFV